VDISFLRQFLIIKKFGQVNGETTGSGDIDIHKGQKFKLRVIGKDATGAYL